MIEPVTPEHWREIFKGADDDTIRRPLWEFPPKAAKPLIHEKRRRFGWDDGDDIDPEYH